MDLIDIKGWTVDGMDGLSLFENEPLIVFITIYFFLVFNFEFYFLQRYCTKVAPLCNWGNPLAMCYRLLATLWQICYTE